MNEYVLKLYEEYKNEPMIGIYKNRSPSLIVLDLNLVKDVLIKDFSTFNDRGHMVFERTEPLSLNIVSLEAKKMASIESKTLISIHIWKTQGYVPSNT